MVAPITAACSSNGSSYFCQYPGSSKGRPPKIQTPRQSKDLHQHHKQAGNHLLFEQSRHQHSAARTWGLLQLRVVEQTQQLQDQQPSWPFPWNYSRTSFKSQQWTAMPKTATPCIWPLQTLWTRTQRAKCKVRNQSIQWGQQETSPTGCCTSGSSQ
jgi:hypothetical protein